MSWLVRVSYGNVGGACVRVKLITSPPGSKRGGKGPAVPFKGLLKFPKDLIKFPSLKGVVALWRPKPLFMRLWGNT